MTNRRSGSKRMGASGREGNHEGGGWRGQGGGRSSIEVGSKIEGGGGSNSEGRRSVKDPGSRIEGGLRIGVRSGGENRGPTEDGDVWF